MAVFVVLSGQSKYVVLASTSKKAIMKLMKSPHGSGLIAEAEEEIKEATENDPEMAESKHTPENWARVGLIVREIKMVDGVSVDEL
jgi:hypothetical protein